MSSAPSDDRLRLLVGGSGRCRFAIDMADVERVDSAEATERPHRSVNVPRLFDMPGTDPDSDRFARIKGPGDAAYLRLGPALSLESPAADRFVPVPACLGMTAARWGWRALAWDEDGHALVLLDAPRLASLGALCGAEEEDR